jgi:hypothetical protein
VTDQTQPLNASAPAGDESAGSSGLPVNLAGVTAVAEERPEVVVGAAFAGGFLLAMILKRLAR